MRGARLLALFALWATPLRAQVSARADLISADAALAAAVFDRHASNVIAPALGANGVLVWPGAAVVQGAASATRFLARQPMLATTRISWQPFRIEIAPDSTLGLVTGVTVIDHPAADNVPEIHRIGRFLEAWRRVGGTWQLVAFSLVNSFAAGEMEWSDDVGPREMPLLRSIGPAGPFIGADSTFAADAGRLGASAAFARWAAPDATTFASTGETIVGPARIGAAFAGNTAHWEWGAVVAGSSADGMLGWTVGQATITPASGGQPSKSKYLTLWRRMPDGSIRFIADGGNARP